MPSISLFSGSFCHGEDVARLLSRAHEFELIEDQNIVTEVGERFGMSENKIRAALSGDTSIFDRFTHEKERCLAFIKLALAERLRKDRLLFFGYASHLLPEEITHVLRVGIIAEKKYRVQGAMEERGLPENQALKLIHKEDEKVLSWTSYLFNKDSWDASLYDMIVPMDKKSVDDAVNLILEYVKKDILKTTPASARLVEDFVLASRVETALGKAAHDVSASARDGHVTLTINKHVLILSRFEEDLKKIVLTVPGVKDVDTKVGPGYYENDIYRDFDLKQPTKVVLVDDERDYVETLSDRLLVRDMRAAVVYDGKEALSYLEKEEPEVMVLDLKMPGIDGIEVLRRVKEGHPHVEVIVLTGFASKEDEKTCLELGAFAYLEKPVDVEVLTQKMREAHRKAVEKRSNVSDRKD